MKINGAIEISSFVTIIIPIIKDKLIIKLEN